MKCQIIFQKIKKDLSCAVAANGGNRPNNMSQHMRFLVPIELSSNEISGEA